MRAFSNIIAAKMNLLEDPHLNAMARRNFGYGRWDAKYWFIGPEQGMGKHEKDDIPGSLKRRAECWRTLGSLELSDCRQFHCCIGERNWHRKKPKVNLQTTWQPLILLLMTYLKRDADQESCRNYQRDRWGRLDGETCVIELSGLAAPDALTAVGTEHFLPERIRAICDRLREHQPDLVLMYGRKQQPSWNAIAKCYAGREFPPEGSYGLVPKAYVLHNGPTRMVSTPHSSRTVWDGTRYIWHDYWKALGLKLR
ncbi:MAG TPA: hypothetical protein VGS27_02245 [Candidatus Sulfotelmatobacter sp.]|nr:hypothetical protein [Candidatus Sulfotelmatobacter sp.]